MRTRTPGGGQAATPSGDGAGGGIGCAPKGPLSVGATTLGEHSASGSRWTRKRIVARLWELIRFGSVGGVAFVVDIGLFNLLRFGPGELLEDKPLTAKVISVAVATLVSWVGNRYWTFAHRRTENRVRELIGFVIVNIGGMGVAVACLWFSHYVLGFTSPLADNISANGVGLVLGMVFRYLAYRNWVFTKAENPRA